MGIISELSCKVAREMSSYADAVDLSLKQGTFDVARFAGSGSPSMFAGGGSGGAQAQMYQEFKGWVYVAINAIARRAASQAVIAARKEMAEQIGKGKRLPSSKVPKSWREKANEGVAFEVLEGHKAVDVFDNPNPIQGRWEFTYTTVANMYIAGEFYWIGGVVEGEDGDRLEVYSLPAHWIEDQHNGGLFTGYKLKLPGDYEGIPLEPEQVVRGYLPDPSNPLKGCISPLATQYPAVRTDAKIQKSQEVSYDNGIYPQMAITVSSTVDMDGKPTGQRPVLTGAQRRQIVAGVRQLVGGVMNSNQPLVLDGLIEKVFPLTTAPREMDWLKSGDQVKTRIFQAFGLNPINVGEIAGSNRAQAAVADSHMCSHTINPVLDIMSNRATSWCQTLFDDPTLLVWWQPCRPNDEEQRLRENAEMRKHGDISRNEMRAEYGFSPLEEETGERKAILETVGGMQGAAGVLSSLARGEMTREQAIALLDLFFGEGEGSKIVGARPALPAPVVDDGTRAAYVHLLDMVSSQAASCLAGHIGSK